MAKKSYIGVSDIAKKIKEMYVGVSDVARKVKKAYIGVNDVAKLFYEAIDYTPILITSSGTYTVNPDLTYNVVAVGGGGGSAAIWCKNWEEWNTNCIAPGASGGRVTGTFKPTSNTVSVTIGAAGSNSTKFGNNNITANATNGGNTVIGSIRANGGGGGKCFQESYDGTGTATPGTPGGGTGGTVTTGKTGSFREVESWGIQTVYVTGGAGFVVSGKTYGTGGTMRLEEDDDDVLTAPLPGVVLLTPIR